MTDPSDPFAAPMLPLRWKGHGPATGVDPSPAPTRRDAPPPAPPDVRARTLEPDAMTAPPGAPSAPAAPQVEVRISTRRRKSATAFFEGTTVVVVVPAHVGRSERQSLVDGLVKRLLAKRPGVTHSDEDLARRAADLADRYVEGVRPRSIRWVANQRARWGSCTVQTGEIRLSHRLRTVPGWVLDATIVHELAHLLHADHSPAFHAVANRFPRQREALIFLEGYSLGLSGADLAEGRELGIDPA